MAYTKVISYSNIIEVYTYDRYPTLSRTKKRGITHTSSLQNLSDDGKDSSGQAKQQKIRSKESKKRALRNFRRLVQANLSIDNRPILATFTYAENQTSLRLARTHFSHFGRSINALFPATRYISVAEFQRRGAVHFHALFWGLPASLSQAERELRIFAAIWKHGFVDLVLTDGSPKLAGYLSKYFMKQMADSRLQGQKAFVASSNIWRPETGTLIQPFIPELSTVREIHAARYMTQWLGEGRYRKLLVMNTHTP